MKLILICSLISLSLFGCGKTELTCGVDELKSLADKAAKDYLMKDDAMALMLMSLKVRVDEKKIPLPEPTFDNIFPGLTAELTNIRLIDKNKEINRISCEANISSKLSSSIAGIAKKALSEMKSQDSKDLAAVVGGIAGSLEKVVDDDILIAYEAQRTDDNKSVVFKYKIQSKGLQGAAAMLAMVTYSAMAQKEEDKLKPSVKSETMPAPSASASSSAATPNLPVQPAMVASTPTTPPPAPVASAPVAVAPTPVPAPKPEVDTSAFAPSFDCAKASTGPERLICSDRELSKLDVDLSQTYSKAREKSADKNKLKSEQLEWFKRSRNACSDKSCMETAYKQRISELGK